MNAIEKQQFEQYLKSLGLAENTLRKYLYEVERFLVLNPDAKSYGYTEVMEFMATLADKSPATRMGILIALKKYYFYLINTGERELHPCSNVNINQAKKSKHVIFDDLFTPEQLELLLEQEAYYKMLTDRNRLIMSFMIYQALTPQDLVGMKISHIDLDNLKLYVPSSGTLSRRYLPLKTKQFRLIDKYITGARKDILKEKNIKDNPKQLFLGKRGTPVEVQIFKNVVGFYKTLFPEKHLKPKVIRMSVIANWLNVYNYPLEQVQLMAGHKWISSTLRYRMPDPQKQKELINQWHPLG